MTFRLAIGTGVGLMLTVAVAVAGTPFGGDDTGFVPPDKNTLKCETSISNAAGKLGAAVLTCHAKTAGAGVASKAFDEEGCENKALAKYTATAAKVAPLCPPCIDSVAISNTTTGQLDGLANALFFCDSTSGAHLGDGDDLGWVPSDKVTLKCQASVAKNVGKAEGAIVKCHIKEAGARLANKPFDEEACESAALVKLAAANAKVASLCPPCLAANLASLPAVIESGVDTSGGPTYCASPSGAFVDCRR